jgi:four helix bundle protein
MIGSRSFKDLLVWQRSMELVREVYKITKQFPRSEEFALSNQLRRCAVSIPSNISEGSKRGTQKDFSQFLRIANGSSAELETQLLIAKDEYSKVNYGQAFALLDEVQRMLNKLSESMQLKTRN